jgi:hypothetical protein
MSLFHQIKSKGECQISPGGSSPDSPYSWGFRFGVELVRRIASVSILIPLSCGSPDRTHTESCYLKLLQWSGAIQEVKQEQ